MTKITIQSMQCIKLLAGVVATFLAVTLASAQSASPNIIYFLADDLGLGDVSAYQDVTGNADADQIHTPSIDQLANRGVRFTDAHSSSSVCAFSRYSLLTGRHAWRVGPHKRPLLRPQADPLIEKDRPTLASMLRDVGYNTGMVGKWHLGLTYRNSDGMPADGWSDADLTQPMFDTPVDHGFNFFR
ncbi:MAG: sulfatase-like hydrolase/transferase, partial [Planctomycetota bacterium]